MAGVLHAAAGLDKKGRPTGAALGGHAALGGAAGERWRRGRGAPIEVCIDASRRVRPQSGYRFVRVEGLADRADWMRTPPYLRAPEATLDLVLRANDTLAAVGLITDVIQTRCTDAAGTCSVLEHRFLTDVVRAHGLPEPTRQSPRIVTDGGRRREYRDAEWVDEGLVVEQW